MKKNWVDPFRNEYQSDQYPVYLNDVKLGNGKGGTASNTKGPIYPEKVNLVTDEKYYEELYNLYANVLNAKGYNLKDTFSASMCYFNKVQNRLADPATNGKTYIFVTRPDCNFWQAGTGVRNVEMVNIFNYMSRMQIGRAVMPWLMFPDGMPMEFEKDTGASYAVRETIGKHRIWSGQGTFQRNGDGSVNFEKTYAQGLDSGIISNAFTPFIPIISNCCTSCTGAKDLSLETKTTEGDYHGNKLQYAKAGDETFEPGEISLEFDDIYGSPILHLINLWVNYIHFLSKGVCTTWGYYVKYRIIDYTCSVYIFMTEKDGMTISRWAKWTGCFPKSVPLSNIQHNIQIQPDVLRTLSVPFAYNRYEPMNPATLVDFNTMMNKFIFQKNASRIKMSNVWEKNRNWQRIMGVAPEMLFKPTSDPSILIGSHNEWYGPKYLDPSRNFVDKDINYYQNKFWGTTPYIIDHKLVWLDPTKLNFTALDNAFKHREITSGELKSNIRAAYLYDRD